MFKTGDPGVGKTILIRQILQQLERYGGGRDGSAAKRLSILGNILNYSEKRQNLLDQLGFAEFTGQKDEEGLKQGFCVF